MGGARQFNILFRKNLLLKTRRPISTCFELTLPVALFALLAYVRGIYKPSEYGNFWFAENTIYPMSTFNFDLDKRSQALVDVCGEACESQDTESIMSQRLQDDEGYFRDLAEMKQNMYKSVACNDNMLDKMASVIQPLLVWQWKWDRNSTTATLEEWLAETPAEDIGAQIEDLINKAQSKEFLNDVIDEVRSRRDSYLGSTLKADIESFASDVDSTVEDLKADIPSIFDPSTTLDDAAKEDVRNRVEAAVDDLCNLTGFAQWRASTISFSFAGYNLTISVSLGSLVDGLNALVDQVDQGLSINGSSVAADLRASADNLLNGTIAEDLDLSTLQSAINRLWDELIEMNVVANGTDSSRSFEANTTTLSNELNEIAKAFEDYFSNRDVAIFRNAQSLIEDLARLLDSGFNFSFNASTNTSDWLLAAADWIDNSWASNQVSGLLEWGASLTNDLVPIEAAAKVEESLWWLSHFAREGSITARLLSELKEETPWEDETDGAYHTTLGLRVQTTLEWSQAQEWSAEVDKIFDDLAEGLRTGNFTLRTTWIEDFVNGLGELAGVYRQNGTRLRADLESFLESIQHQLNQSYALSFKEDVSGVDVDIDVDIDASLSTPSTTGLSALLRTLGYVIGNLTSDGALKSSQHIDDWEREWKAQCPNWLNKTAIGDMAVRVVSGCPFYRRVASDVLDSDFKLRSTVDDVNNWIRDIDLDQLKEDASKLQNLTVEVDASSMRATVERVATGYKSSVELGLCLKPQSNGCMSITDEETCLKSRTTLRPMTAKDDAGNTFYISATRCAWCGGGPCLNISDAACMSEAIIEGASDKITSGANISVASSSCTTQDALSEILSRELQAIFGIDCEEASGATASSSSSSESSSSASKAAETMMERLQSRKILVAPYRGEVKKLWDLILVEGIVSLTKLPPSQVIDNAYRVTQLMLDCPLVKTIGTYWLQNLTQDWLMFVDSEAEIEAFARTRPAEILAGIVFNNVDSDGNFPDGDVNVDFSIRFSPSLIPSTNRIFYAAGGAMLGRPRTWRDTYIYVFFVHVQETIGRAVARMQGKRTAEAKDSESTELKQNIQANNMTRFGRELTISLEQLPAPGYTQDDYIRVIQHTMPMIMILGWIYAVALLVREMVYEKQERLRDVMRIMGLKTWVYWASWMASAMVQMTLLSTVMVAVLCGGKVLMKSNFLVIWCFFVLYSMSTVSLSLFISSFFSRAKVAAACGGMIYYTLYLPYSFFNRFDDVMGTDWKNFLCLLCPTAFGAGSATIAKWELLEEGAQWSNLFTPPPVTYSGSLPSDDHSFGHVWMMLAVDTILYQVLAWYIEKVFPGSLGLPQPWYFPVLPSFWFPKAPLPVEEHSIQGQTPEQSDNAKLECFEHAPMHLETSVKLRQLTKKFRNGKRALSGVSLDMHKDTIVGYLGHNGAGKSTTMSILTGLYPPTSGDVLVNGVSVCKDSHGVRRQLGVCLQHNALYENITVQEHLQLFCCLKSVPWSTMKDEIDRLLKDTGLEAKRHFPTRALSGGMKRKLSVAIALCGGSKVVTLDEPTAGVDATSRRDIWQLLSKHKDGRTILLSTHFMDEADILSDRIAIIAEGQLTAIGTALALKRKFTDGYMLTVVAQDGASNKKLVDGIREMVPEARYAGERGRELSFCLPFGSRGRFSTLFSQLQDDKVRNALNIDSYGLSAASMEEVFLSASSVHEAGLHGKVRNATQEVPALVRDDSTNEGSSDTASHKLPPHQVSSEETASTGSGNPSIQDISGEVSPTHLHLDEKSDAKSIGRGAAAAAAATTTIPPSEDPTTPSSFKTTSKSDRPRSPQCMGENTETPRVDEVRTKGKRSAEDLSEDDEDLSHPKRLSGPALLVLQFWALFCKRALSVRRDRKAWASQLLLPSIFVLLALIVAKMSTSTEDQKPLAMNSDMFVGSRSAGSVQTDIPYNLWRISGTRNTELGANLEKAFTSLQDDVDFFQYYPETNVSTLAHYYRANRRALNVEQGGMSVRGTSEQPRLTLWFKFFSDHINPVLVNTLNNARFQAMGFTNTHVQAWNYPLPQSASSMSLSINDLTQVYTDMLVAITLILAMGFIPASFVVYLVHEKSSNGKHQQLLSGVGPTMYWVNSYVWDMINFLVPLVACACIFEGFAVASYSGGNLSAVLALLFLYGACMTPFMYCLEVFFSVASTAYVTLIVGNIFTGTLTVLATSVMDAYESELPELVPINNATKMICPWLLPNYCLGRGLIKIATNHYYNYIWEEFAICYQVDGVCPRSPFSFDVAGELLIKLVIMIPAWLSLRLLIEWGFCTRGLRKQAARLLSDAAKPSDKQDPAVAIEASKVEELMAAAKANGTHVVDPLVLTDLRKTFVHRRCGVKSGRAFHAVRGISCSVAGGECFGLLGVNGAGKTTTMRMITGHTDLSRGDILVGGYSAETNRDRARQRLGYCPQFDALPDKLTVRETVALYTRIRGISPFSVQKTVQHMIRRMCLEAHQNQLCENLSGGNKRKLSTALALIGSPDVVLLDEPSTGVDVGARRFLWEVISGIRSRGHAVVLTSHSMEECEVLCTRLTIMVHGELRCLGTPTELKNKFGGGYTLAVKANLNTDQDLATKTSAAAALAGPCAKIRDFIAKEVPTAVLTEESVGLLRYRLAAAGGTVPLAETFQLFEQAKESALKGCITDYSVSQTSLEEVFLHFSQLGEREYAAGLGREVELPTAASSVLPLPEAAAAYLVESDPSSVTLATEDDDDDLKKIDIDNVDGIADTLGKDAPQLDEQEPEQKVPVFGADRVEPQGESAPEAAVPPLAGQGKSTVLSI